MRDVEDLLIDSKYKFKSSYRDDKYHKLSEMEKSGIFKSITDTFLCAFAIGYHFDQTSVVKGGNSTVNHVNLVSIPGDVRELLLRLIRNRYPQLDTPDDIWSKVEEYAEMGIQLLYDSVSANNWMLLIDDIMELK
jgi:hypothetical protein